MRTPTTLLTGGAGFIGSHLAEALLERGHRVVVLDNFNAFYAPAAKLANIAAVRATARRTGSELRVLKGDLRQPSDIRRAVKAAGHPADVSVVHLAAMAGVRPSIEQPQLYHAVNVGGTLNLLDICREAGLRRLVFASSSSVYGNNTRIPFAEADPVDHPISPYAVTKKAGELLCHNYHHLYGISVAALRFFTVYGPRQRPDLAIHKFARLLDAGRPLPFYGDGTTRRDYTFISDTLQGVLGALDWIEADVPRYEIFNLGEARTVDLATLVTLLGRAMGREPQLERLPPQPGDVSATWAAIDKARMILGYRPEVAIEDGLERFVAWFRRQEGGPGRGRE